MLPLLHHHVLAALILAAGPPGQLPGPVEPQVVGAWACGDTRVVITEDGGIEISGEDARTGLIRAAAGRALILWTAGGESEWAYAAGDGALILATDRGPNYACLAEK